MLSHGNCIITSSSLKREKFQNVSDPITSWNCFTVSFYFTTILKNIFDQFVYFTTCNSEQKHVFRKEIHRKHPGLFREVIMHILKQSKTSTKQVRFSVPTLAGLTNQKNDLDKLLSSLGFIFIICKSRWFDSTCQSISSPKYNDD